MVALILALILVFTVPYVLVFLTERKKLFALSEKCWTCVFLVLMVGLWGYFLLMNMLVNMNIQS